VRRILTTRSISANAAVKSYPTKYQSDGCPVFIWANRIRGHSSVGLAGIIF
jgi:hypothetical protein